MLKENLLELFKLSQSPYSETIINYRRVSSIHQIFTHFVSPSAFTHSGLFIRQVDSRMYRLVQWLVLLLCKWGRIEVTVNPRQTGYKPIHLPYGVVYPIQEQIIKITEYGGVPGCIYIGHEALHEYLNELSPKVLLAGTATYETDEYKLPIILVPYLSGVFVGPKVLTSTQKLLDIATVTKQIATDS
jgi:hypothetical protein